MKEISAEFIRLEINRVGSIVVETGLFHPSGIKLHSAGDVLGLDESRALHAANFTKLFLLEFGEDERDAKKSLGIEHVLAAKVVVGDQLAEDIRQPNGALLLREGLTVDEAAIATLQSAHILAVPIRHRKLAAAVKPAEDYVAKKPAAAPAVRETARITRVAPSASSEVRYLLIPRARVLLGMADDLLRTMLVNGLKSEGHEPLERKSAGAAVEDLFEERPHVLIVDLEEATSALARVRTIEGIRNLMILVCAADPKSTKLTDALYIAANAWLPRPPSRELLNDKIKACQDLLLRRVQIAPSLRSERRAGARATAKGEVELQDPTLGMTLPVTVADIVDRTETGIRIAYNTPRLPCPWAYTPHGVHLRHPFHGYATSNPMPRELRLKIKDPKGAVEKSAWVAHISPQIGGIESMGLTFRNPAERPVERQTAIRKKF